MEQMPTQVSTLPDPQVAIQQVNVGRPRPFAGFTNSDFAYIGLGVSQDFPYPGKLKLRRELANKDAEVAEQKIEAIRLAVLSDLPSKTGHDIGRRPRTSSADGASRRSEVPK